MKKLLIGNEAVARGLYEGGLNVVSSYPGTPSTEITEFLAKYDDIHSVKLYGVVYIVKRINHTYDFISLSEYEADTYCKLFCTDIVFEHWLSKNKGTVHYNIH